MKNGSRDTDSPTCFAKIAKEYGCARIVGLKGPWWRKRLFDCFDPQFVVARPGGLSRGSNTFLQLLDVVRDKLKAVTAVVEPYVSTDWNAEYSAVYSRVFKQVPQSAQRVHFFADIKKELALEDLFLISPELRYAYRGYTVVRPIGAFRVGDTVLSPPCIAGPPHRDLVHCLARFDTSLLGNRLEVIGMPFMQQETTVGVCAEADLWMVARYLNKKGETRRYRPPDITELATQTITYGPPREGLFDFQMADACRRMGLNPVILHTERPDETREFMNTCVESGLPVIAGIPGHVVVVVGHEYGDRIELDNDSNSMSGAIRSFIAHDDASGPYQRMEVGAVPKCLPQHGGIEVLSLGGAEVDMCLTAFPPRVNMTWEDVKKHTDVWFYRTYISRFAAESFENLPDADLWTAEDLDDLILRSYLRLSRDFKQDLVKGPPADQRHPDIIAKYRCMPMPKYVWVVELAKRSDVVGKSPYDRRIRGEIVLDSTACRHVPEEALLAFNYDGIMFAPRFKRAEANLIVTDKHVTYRPLVRATRVHEPSSE